MVNPIRIYLQLRVYEIGYILWWSNMAGNSSIENPSRISNLISYKPTSFLDFISIFWGLPMGFRMDLRWIFPWDRLVSDWGAFVNVPSTGTATLRHLGWFLWRYPQFSSIWEFNSWKTLFIYIYMYCIYILYIPLYNGISMKYSWTINGTWMGSNCDLNGIMAIWMNNNDLITV